MCVCVCVSQGRSVVMPCWWCLSLVEVGHWCVCVCVCMCLSGQVCSYAMLVVLEFGGGGTLVCVCVCVDLSGQGCGYPILGKGSSVQSCLLVAMLCRLLLEQDCAQCRVDLEFLQECIEKEQDFASSVEREEEKSVPTLAGDFMCIHVYN